MGMMIDCHKVNPSGDCHHVIRADSMDEVLKLAGKHAREVHKMEPTPELLAKVKSFIEVETKGAPPRPATR